MIELDRTCTGIKLHWRMLRAYSTAAWKLRRLLLLCQTAWPTLPPR